MYYSSPKDLQTKQLTEFDGHKDEVNCVSFSSDFSFMVTGSDDQRVRVFDVKTKQCNVRLRGHKGAVKSVAISPCDRYFASGSFDKTARIWKTDEGSCLHILKGHTKSVEVVAFSSCSVYLCTGSWDRTAILWCVQTGCCIRTFSGHGSLVQSVAFSLRHEIVASGSWDFTVRVWTLNHIENMRIVDTFIKRKKAHVNSEMCEDSVVKEDVIEGDIINVSEDVIEGDIINVSEDVIEGDIINVSEDVIEGDIINVSEDVIEGDIINVTEDVIEGDIINVSEDEFKSITNDVRIIEKDGEQRTMENKSSDSKESDTCSGEGIYIGYKKACQWKEHLGNANKVDDIISDKENYTISVEDNDATKNRGIDEVNSKVTNEKLDQKVTSQNDTEGKNQNESVKCHSDVNDTDDMDGCKILKGHTGNVHAVSFSKYGMLASGSWDRSVRIWNPLNCNCIQILLGHTGWVQAVTFSPDATYCASAADDESIKVWDLVTGECVNTLEGGTYLAHHCAFTPNGHLIAAGASSPPVEKQHGETESERAQLAEQQIKAILNL